MRSALKNHSKKLRSKRRRSRLVFCLDFSFKSTWRQFRFWTEQTLNLKKNRFFRFFRFFTRNAIYASMGSHLSRLRLQAAHLELLQKFDETMNISMTSSEAVDLNSSVCFDSEHSWQILKLWPAQLLNLPPCVQAMSRPTINFCCSGSANRALGRAGFCNLLHFNLVLLTSWS